MSSFVVSDKTLNRILTFLSHWDFGHDSDLKFAFFSLDKKLEGGREDTLTRIGLVLKKVNTEAVNQRYNEKSKVESFVYKYEKCKVYQAYQHLGCLTYQMHEGNVPKTKVYKLLQRIEQAMAVVIADENPHVNKAEWDAE